MRPVVGLGVSALVVLFACTGYAEGAATKSEEYAKKTVTAYLRAAAKGDYAAMDSLFTRDARLRYTYKWGHGYEDTVYELDLAKDPKLDVFDDDVRELHMSGYATIERESQIQRVSTRPDGRIWVNALVTEKYRYRGYTGTAKTTLDLVVCNPLGAARIAVLTSVTTY